MTLRPDDLVAGIVERMLAVLPGLDTDEIDDLILGTARPAGEGGFNLGRAVAVILGHDRLPATTVDRYCASSLQAAWMAFHSVAVGEADVVVAGGVEAASRFDRGTADSRPDTQNPVFDEAQARSAEQAEQGPRGGSTRGRRAGCPTSTSRWGWPRRTLPGAAG